MKLTLYPPQHPKFFSFVVEGCKCISVDLHIHNLTHKAHECIDAFTQFLLIVLMLYSIICLQCICCHAFLFRPRELIHDFLIWRFRLQKTDMVDPLFFCPDILCTWTEGTRADKGNSPVCEGNPTQWCEFHHYTNYPVFSNCTSLPGVPLILWKWECRNSGRVRP